MKRFVSLLAAALIVILPVLSFPAHSNAVAIQNSPPPSTSPGLIITSIISSASQAGGSLLDDLEVFNQSDAPINFAGWSFSFTVKGTGCAAGKMVAVNFPAGWILSKKYFTFVRGGAVDAPGTFSLAPDLLAGCTAAGIASAELLQADSVEQTVFVQDSSGSATLLAPSTIAQHKQRNNSLSSARTLSGSFTKDYGTALISTATAPLYSDPLYTPPADDGGVQVLEILPNAKNCSPADTDPTCGDYVKLYNPTDQPINLALYRLRIGYKGQSSSITNTFTWGQTVDPADDELDLPPHAYFTLTARNDGEPLSVTDTGDYIWIEDGYGIQTYQPIVQYPDASSSTKVGWAWALDGATWQWTSAPQPDAPNYFPPADQTSTSTSTTTASSSLQPCAPNQYRNPVTNRCKLIVSASTLVPCKPNQTRDQDTNRCRSVLATSTGLVACQPGQERNPTTNRCRAVLGASTTLKPCAAGQLRNSTTNRCRKATTGGIANVQDVKAISAGGNGWRWPVAGLVVVGALAYALYEWRQDAALLLDKLKTKSARLAPRRFTQFRKQTAKPKN